MSELWDVGVEGCGCAKKWHFGLVQSTNSLIHRRTVSWDVAVEGCGVFCVSVRQKNEFHI